MVKLKQPNTNWSMCLVSSWILFGIGYDDYIKKRFEKEFFCPFYNLIHGFVCFFPWFNPLFVILACLFGTLFCQVILRCCTMLAGSIEGASPTLKITNERGNKAMVLQRTWLVEGASKSGMRVRSRKKGEGEEAKRKKKVSPLWRINCRRGWSKDWVLRVHNKKSGLFINLKAIYNSLP